MTKFKQALLYLQNKYKKNHTNKIKNLSFKNEISYFIIYFYNPSMY
jgi:hypothetical protein